MSITPLELALSKLPDAKKNGKGFKACCPAHDDKNPSLSVWEDERGGVGVKCHAGCARDAVLGALGFSGAEFRPPREQANGRPKPQSKPQAKKPSGKLYSTAQEAIAALERQHGPHAAQWTYHDADGKPVGVVVRWNLADGKKEIRPVSLHAEGWRIGGMPEPRPLYRLPELKDAERVYVAEGEKAAEAARSIGLICSTSPHGAKSASKADWSIMAGKDVVIHPDHDDAGEKYADDVLRILLALTLPAKARIVRLAEIEPSLPEGGDMADLIELWDGKTADEIRAAVKAAADAAPLATPETANASTEFSPFPLHLLPEPVRDYIAQASASIRCDPSYIATPLLAVLAGAVGNSRRLRINSTWSEPCIIWAAIVGKSGTLKTPALNLVKDALARRQDVLFREYREQAAEYQRDRVIYEADLKEWKNKGRKKGEPAPEEPPEPRLAQYIAQDTTVEALAVLLEDNPRGILVACDELSGWVNSFDAYKSVSGKDVAQWLSIHSGVSITVNRKTGKTLIHVPRPAVSIVGGIQPGTLARALGGRSEEGGDGEHFENGLAARLLFAMPPPQIPYWSDTELPPATKQALDDLVGRLLALEMDDADDDPKPLEVALDDDAQQEWIQRQNRHAEELAVLPETLAATSAKCKAYAARFALLVHLVRDESAEVDAASVRAGWELSRWYFEEAVRVLAILGKVETNAEQELRELVRLVQGKGGCISPRQLQHATRKYRQDASAAEAALQKLVGARLGEWEVAGPTPAGGRPSRVLRLFSSRRGNTTPRKPEESEVPLPLPAGTHENRESDMPGEWGEV